jgi:alpha-1,3/alpha-1,6-mannosyltransferase
VKGVWSGLGGTRGIGVVYPCVNTKLGREGNANGLIEEKSQEKPLWEGKKIILSINRFERKKNIELAIKAYAGIRPKERHNTRLVIAGNLSSRHYL